MQHQLHLEKPLSFIDLETTGMNTAADKIVQIGIVTALPDNSVTQYEQKVNPEIAVSPEAEMVHGLSNRILKAYPTFGDISKDLFNLLSDHDLGGFNILKFDLPVLMAEFKRVGIDFDISDKKIVDAQKIFHLMEPRTLTAALQFYCNTDINSLAKQNAHDAQTDALATLLVVDAQVKKYQGQTITDAKGVVLPTIENNLNALNNFSRHNMVDLMGRFVKNEEGEILLNFGKHKGKLLKQILQKEPHFYDWMMRGDFPTDTKNQLTKVKMEMVQEQLGK